MSELPKSWGLTATKNDAGKTQIIGTNSAGEQYVARTCEQDGITDTDLKILDLGSPEKRNIDGMIGYFRDERDTAKKNWEHSQDEGWFEGAERVTHVGLHMRESTVGYSRLYAQKWDSVFGSN